MACLFKMSIVFPVLALALSVFVFFNNLRKIQNIIFLLIGFAGSFFTFFIFMSYLFPGRPELTTVFNRFSVAFTISQAAFNLYFAMVFPTIRIEKLFQKFLMVCLPAMVIAAAAVSTDMFVLSMEVVSRGGSLTMVREVGILYPTLYGPSVAAYILVSCVCFVIQYKKSTTGMEKKHVLYTALAIGVGGAACTITCIVLPSMGITRLYPFGPMLVAPFYVSLMTYNILSLKAMDIDQLISRTIVWGLSALIIVCLTGYAVYTIFSRPDIFNAAGATLLMLLCVMLVLAYVMIVQPRIDRGIRKKSYHYRDIVDGFNRRMLKLTTLDEFVDSTLETISTTLYPSNISFFLKQNEDGVFLLKKALNYSGTAKIVLTKDQVTAIPFSFNEVIEKEQVERNPAYEEYRQEGALYFKAFQCVLAVPIVFEGSVIGVINLGPKYKGFYKRIEIEFLEKLMMIINIALYNSMLLKEIEEMNISNSRFVPKQFLSYLGHQKLTDVKLGDHVQREMTVIFCDIKDFTTLSENLTPEQNFMFLNAYLKRVSPVIRNMNGFIDKYVGDAIMALFPDSPEDALDAALMMLKGLEKYNKSNDKTGFHVPLDVGIGLHTGLLMLGTIGEEERMEGTVISDAVNLTSRIEGMTRVFGSKIIISDSAFSKLGDPDKYSHRYLGRVRVKGKNKAVRLYEIFEGDPPLNAQIKNKTKKNFERAVYCMENEENETAKALFKRVMEAGFQDQAAIHYLDLLNKRV